MKTIPRCALVSLLALSLGCKSGPPDAAPKGSNPRAASRIEGREISAAEDATPPLDVCPALLAGVSLPAIRPADAPIRFVAFGDFGDGSPEQLAVARAMERYDADRPIDFGLTLGDNFYPRGINSPASPRWEREWEQPYGPLGVRLYATLGNHDRYDKASPGAEMARSRQSSTWCLPLPYYTFQAGPVQFFALDTDPIELGEDVSEQLSWLDRELGASTARWKVAFGHHPIFSSGTGHGDSPAQRATLLPVLTKHHVALYLAGHDHHMELQRPAGGVSFLVSGAGGHEVRPVEVTSPCVAWALGTTPGFAVLDVDDERIEVEFRDDDGEILFSSTIRPDDPSDDRRDCVR